MLLVAQVRAPDTGPGGPEEEGLTGSSHAGPKRKPPRNQNLPTEPEGARSSSQG